MAEAFPLSVFNAEFVSAQFFVKKSCTSRALKRARQQKKLSPWRFFRDSDRVGEPPWALGLPVVVFLAIAGFFSE